MKKLAVGLAALAGLAVISTAASAAEGVYGPRDGSYVRGQAYGYGTLRDRGACMYDPSVPGSYRPSTNRFHDNPDVYGNPDRD
jgi:hypothetical protein